MNDSFSCSSKYKYTTITNLPIMAHYLKTNKIIKLIQYNLTSKNIFFNDIDACRFNPYSSGSTFCIVKRSLRGQVGVEDTCVLKIEIVCHERKYAM